MLGFVLRDSGKISSELQVHKILLAEGINNIFNNANLSHPLNWKWPNLLTSSPILLIIFISIIFILLFLYKTSELINKKKLGWMLVMVILLFIFSNILIFIKNQPPKVSFRLSFFPLQTEPNLTRSTWIGKALLTMTTQEMQNSVLNQAIVSPVEWTEFIFKIDSANNLNYLKRLSQNIQAEYFLISKLSGDKFAPKLTYQMVQANSGEAVINGEATLSPEKLPQISIQMSNEILKYFQIKPKKEVKFFTFISHDAYQKYLNGQNSYRQKKYQFALEQAQQAIAMDSSMVDAYLLTGKIWFMIGLDKKKKGDSPIEEFERAREWLSRTVELHSTRDEAYAFLGEYYIYRERWSLAEQMLVKAYQLNPNNPRLYLTFSRLHKFRYQKLGFKNEEQLFKHAIFINPCYEDAYLMLADYYLFENEREKAIRVLEQFLEINPDSVPVLMALGKVYLVRREIFKIIEIYNRVIALDPNNSDAFYNLGILYYNSEDYENAEKFLRRAIAIDNHLNANLYLAYLYEIKGDYDKAIEYLRRRIRYRKGLDDEFAEEARKHLFKLLHVDSMKVNHIDEN